MRAPADSSADPAAFDPEDLVRHGRFVKALARELVRDSGEADELAARTFAAALERRPVSGPGLRVWLRRVAQRLFLRSRRDDERRLHRELVAVEKSGSSGAPVSLDASGATSPATVDVAARLELERDVATAFSTLAEPYRTALFLRFFDDLPPREIAARLGAPVETIRTRLKRGLERLRAELDAVYTQRRVARTGPLDREARTVRDDRSDWRATAIALAADFSKGGALVATAKTKLALAAGVIVLLAGGATWSIVEARRVGAANTSSSTTASKSIESAAARGAEATSEARRSSNVERVAERVLPFASGVVVDEFGSPLADVDVVASRLQVAARTVDGDRFGQRPLDAEHRERDRLATTSTDGRFVVAEPRNDLVAFYFVKDGFAPTQWDELSPERAENQERRVVLATGRRFRGVVHDSSARPMSGASLALIPRGQRFPGPEKVARVADGSPKYWASTGAVIQSLAVDAQARFEARAAPTDSFHLFVSELGYASKILESTEFGDTLDVTLIREAMVVDVVDARDGVGLPSARGLVTRADDPAIKAALLPWHDEWEGADAIVSRPPGRLLFWQRDDAGQYSRVLHEGVEQRCAARLRLLADGRRAQTIAVELARTGEPPHFTVALEAGADDPSIVGTIRGASSSHVDLRWIDPGITSSNWQNELPFASRDVGADGAFAFRGLLPGTYTLFVTSAGRTPRTIDVVAPVDDVKIDLAASATLEVVAVNGKGEPQQGMTVVVQTADGVRAWSKKVDATGLAAVEGLPDGKLYYVAVPSSCCFAPSGATMTLPREQTAEEDAVTLAPGERRRVTARVPGPVDVTFRVRRRDGSHAVGVKIRSFQRRRTRDRGAVLRELEQRTRYLRLTTDANGEAQAEIAPGDFDVEILAAGVTSHRTVSIPRSGPTTIDVEVVEVAGFATVRGRVVELGRPEVAIVGRPVYAWTLGSNGDRASVRATTDSNGGFELEKVLAGTVRVQAMACSTSDGSIDSTSPYRHTNRTVELTPGQELELTISVPRDEEPAATADVVTIDLSIVDASNGTGVLDANVLVLGSSGEDEYDLASLTVDREGRLRRRVPKFERYRVHVGVVRDVHGEPQRPFEAQWIDLVPVDGQVRKTVELRRTPDSK